MELTPLRLIIPDFYVGPKLQAAINDAADSTKAAVWIPASYPGNDTYTNPSNVPVFDMRGTGSTSFVGGSAYNVRNFGAKGDARYLTGLTVSGNHILSATDVFTAADVGKYIQAVNSVFGIAALNPATVLVVNGARDVTVNGTSLIDGGAVGTIGTDDSALVRFSM